MHRIKLMADYDCHPIWDDSGDPGNIDPNALPLTESLKLEFAAWANQLDSLLDRTDPANTKWPNRFWSDFNSQGRALAARLRTELGPEYRVREYLWGEDS